MVRQPRYNLLFAFHLLLILSGAPASGDSSFDCHVKIDSSTYDLTKAAGEFLANQTRETPPTSTFDQLRFDLCSDLKRIEGVAEQDQCPEGTRACLTQTNKKANEPDRVTAVIAIVQSQNLQPKYTSNPSSKSIGILFNGPEYLSSSNPTAQSLNLTFICDLDHLSDPKFIAYDGSRLDIEWSGPAACPLKDDGGGDPKDGENEGEGDKPKEAVGSGLGWFFLVLLLTFLAYFGLGAYYNYSTYGARGLDLLPHRDFWQEVPYMLSDVISHLCSSVRPRRTASRGGYISV